MVAVQAWCVDCCCISADTVARQCLENLRRLRAGEPLLNLVDVARGY